MEQHHETAEIRLRMRRSVSPTHHGERLVSCRLEVQQSKQRQEVSHMQRARRGIYPGVDTCWGVYVLTQGRTVIFSAIPDYRPRISW
jgi:hypothetical protein